MNKLPYFRRLPRLGVLCLFVLGTFTSLMATVSPAKATTFSMQTGYYMGTGVAGKTISGLGFQPELVIIKASSATTAAVFKTSAMPSNTMAYLSATANSTASPITITSNGFSLSNLAIVNTANTQYIWSAFAGSDCTSTGTFCVGTYTGTGTATRTITTGFQPSIVLEKRSTAVASHFRTASMVANRTEFFTSTAADTAGNYLQSFSSTGFTTGVTDNTSTAVYYYIAFKTGAGFAQEGTYTGNGLDNQSIGGLGFQPNLVVMKNSTSATVNNRRAVMSTDQHNGDDASYIADAVADSVNLIQLLQPDGFQVGSGVATNEAAATHYWFALGGVPAPNSGSGTFAMTEGTYTGTGATQSVTGLGFMPDLVVIKDNAANHMVFRTRQMTGDATAYTAVATANFAGGVTALGSDGFTLGTSAITNTLSNTYHWQAFGNAYSPETKSGASDFAIGTYYGRGVDNRQIDAVPYQMDFVAAKGNGATLAAFRSSAQTGDTSGFFSSAAETSNTIQALNSTGFQVGTNVINTSGALVYWFGFKTGTNFAVGSYTGDGVVDKSVVVQSGFSPDLVWVKRTTAVAGFSRPRTIATDASQYFLNTANATGKIKTLTGDGFTVGNSTEVNAAAGIYRYMVWRVPVSGILSTDVVTAAGASVATPSYSMNTVNYPYDCTTSTGVVGTDSQRIRLSNMTSGPSWSLSIAPTDGTTALWRNGGNTRQLDYNDPMGCTDGGDSDAVGGKLRIQPGTATITPQSGCTNTNVTQGSDQTFLEGSIDSITLMSASTGANTSCYWDLTDLNLIQTIPADQPVDGYNIDLTLTATAS